MMKRKMKRLVWVLSALFFLGPPLWARAASQAAPLRVAVSIPPQGYFVRQIGGGLVDVSVMVPPGANPHVFEPKPQQMVALSKSRIYFAVGVTFERAWLRKFAGVNPEMMIVHTDQGIEKLPMAQAHGEAEKGHDDGNSDPHVWLSPPLVMIQARHILDALVKVDPDRRTRYEENYRVFMRDLADLDLKIRQAFSGKQGRLKFMVYHPSWGYFAKSYGLEQIPIEIEGKEPRPRQLEALIRRAREEGVKVIFVQPQFSSKSANTIAQSLEGEVMYADPLASNWAENLLEVVEKLREALR